MTSIPDVFKIAATEFPVDTTTPRPSRKWVSDAEGLMKSGKPQYQEGVVSQKPAFDVNKMTELLYMNHVPLRKRLYKLFEHPDFHQVPGETLSEERARVMRMWGHIVSLGVLKNSISARTAEGRSRYDAVIESCGMVNHSLDIKMSVHYGLFGAAIGLMGDDEQAQEWLPKIENCEMLGCFALTELGHGSNVRGIQTVAEYDTEKKQFVLHTPCEEAQKYWIGGAAISARWAAVFAQLSINGTCYGIHAFLVRIRHDNGGLAQGVHLADCGHKCGMNGVDNGRIWFNHIRVPLKHLLRRFSQLTPEGKYTSQFKSADERFGVSLGSLSGGRVSVASGALNQAKIALTIAIRYSLSRKAFGPPGRPETRLLDYALHQHRLIPPLASTIALQLIQNKLKEKWYQSGSGKELHVWSSGFKALITWHSLSTLQETREACGGQGYKTENRIGYLKSSHDVALTYEGDNHILLQAVTKICLAEFLQGVRNAKGFSGHFAYLNDRTVLQKQDLSSTDVRSPAFAQTVLRRREAALFAKLAALLEKKRLAGVSSLDAFNESALIVEEAGRAHTELVMADVLQMILRQLRQKGDDDIANILSTCGSLFLLSIIDSQAVFMRTGALTVRDASRVHNEIVGLCAELRPEVLHLVDSFGLPPHMLAPIAFDYVGHNSRSRL